MKPCVSEKLCAILHGTHDGDDLHEYDLRLVESAANGILNDRGMGEIDALHRLVAGGAYDASKRWT